MKESETLKARLEAIVAEMVERGILFEDACREFERHFIAAVLLRNNGKISQSADELRIHRNTLRKRVAEFAEQDAASKKRARRRAT